mgnify:CR=1 FL=1
MTKEEIMQAIENMTVLELSELVKEMEEKIRRFPLLLRLPLLLLRLLAVLLLKKNPNSTSSSLLLATKKSALSKLSVKLRASA